MSTTSQETKPFGSKILWVGIVIVIALVGGAFVAFNATSGSSEAATVSSDGGSSNGLEPAPIAGHPAPDFTLNTLDGEQVSLSDFRGQPVIINFWATWCGPCRIEMPEFQEAFAEHQNDGLIVLGVNLTERDSVDAVPGFMEEFGLTFPVVLDEGGDVANTYKVFGQPASIFVNEAGEVHQVFYGPVNKAFIDARVSELLGS
jgi:peroxiredoxin